MGKVISTAGGGLEVKEPVLWEFIVEFSKNFPQSSEVRGGANFAGIIFYQAKREGVHFSPVSKGVIENLKAEWDVEANAFEAFVNLHPNLSRDDRLAFLTARHEQGISVISLPEDYHEENPYLMEVFCNFSDQARVGAMVYYGLKRRQFHADQLAKQFGG